MLKLHDQASCDRYRNTLVLHHRLQELSHPPSLIRNLGLHSPWLELISSADHILYPQLKQGGGINPLVCDLCLSPTLGTSGVSSGHPHTLQVDRTIKLL